jgi:hypothetical protein
MAQNSNDLHDLTGTVLRLQTGVLAFACAVIGGVGLCAMTAWLVIKGGPHVGVHLRLLSQYFYGYSVTWKGSLLGLVYGAITGGAFGWLIGAVYNGVVALRR